MTTLDLNPSTSLHDFWDLGARSNLTTNAQGWLLPNDDFLRLWLQGPELTLLDESCPAEIALHQALSLAPSVAVSPAQLVEIADPDARANYQFFLRFRDELLAAGTLEACYLGLLGRPLNLPPVFLDGLVAAIVGHLQAGQADAFQVRAGQMLFRTQRLSLVEGRLLCVDQQGLDQRQAAAGLLDVLSPGNAADFWRAGADGLFALDLTHEISTELGHGFKFNLTLKHSGLSALARVLEQWLQHFLGQPLSITPLQKVDDPAWSWHIGLDVEAMGLLNDLYEGQPLANERLTQLISLFRLDVPGGYAKPIYLGLAMTADKRLKLKPQNLLLNLPAELALLG
ncbi:DUF6352 family protein [Paucibacter sp. B2R-40]|uniref:DUF6352 family protein n=1 Tax=Paucibacter sp. B2R-40 TaxID=2893554 RepID=UPI0029620763|nr:DUF6352 family protein [Paucibacter sp. B2R-40]